jgi:membrane protein
MSSRSRHKPGLIGNIVRRFRNEKMMQTSAALAFTTLLALVPLVTLVVSVGSVLPFVDIGIRRLDALLVESLLPSGSAGVIAGNIVRFSAKARTLTVPGLVMLSLTAFALLHTIEQTFNHVWQVKPRPYWQRIKLYAFVMLIWPFLLGGLAALMTYAVTTSLGFIDEPTWIRRMVFKGLSMGLLGVFFAFLYYAVPNARVSKMAAAAGGIFATLMFALMQKGFELYLAGVGNFKSVYGAFAAVPIFLIWLYLSWALVLIGGLIAATGSRPQRH